MSSIDWSLVTQSVSAGAIVAALFLHWRQLRAMTMSMQAQGTLEIIRRLQEPSLREARGRLFSAYCAGRPAAEFLTDAENVAQMYDVVGILMRGRMIPKELILRPWGPSICRSWHATEEVVRARRKRDQNANGWDSFEWLYNEARALVGDHYPQQ